MNEGNVFVLFAALGAFLFIFLILGLVIYVLFALGLYKLAQNRNIENPWLAWIPVANLYLLGRLVGTVKISTYEVPKLELVLPIGAILVGILDRIPLLGTLVWLAYLVLSIFVLYKLYSMYRPKDATVWLILSIVLFFMGPIFIYIMRNDTPVQNSSNQL